MTRIFCCVTTETNINILSSYITKMKSAEKKLIQIFKTFIQKSIAPQIKKLDGSLAQWNKFSTLLLADNINIVELQYFVDSLPVWGTTQSDKLQLINRRVTVDNSETSFKANQTFGGERNKVNVYNLGQEKSDNLDQRRQSQKDESLRQRVTQNNLNIMSNLQKLLKGLQENQGALDSMIKQVPTPTSRISRQGSTQYNHQSTTSTTTNTTNTYSGQSYTYISPSNVPHNITANQNHSQTQSHSLPHSQSHSHSQSYTQSYPQTNYIKNYF